VTVAARSSAALMPRIARRRAGSVRIGRVRTDLKTAVLALPLTGHCGEAQALLAELDAELAENSAERGLLDPLVWSAAERAARESIARTVDRQQDLWARYHASDDDKTRVQISGELRLLEASLSRLLKAVPTDLPAPVSIRTQKARRAADSRWA
jgi:hypothetical protein